MLLNLTGLGFWVEVEVLAPWFIKESLSIGQIVSSCRCLSIRSACRVLAWSNTKYSIKIPKLKRTVHVPNKTAIDVMLKPGNKKSLIVVPHQKKLCILKLKELITK